jgi:hypothetical protein
VRNRKINQTGAIRLNSLRPITASAQRDSARPTGKKMIKTFSLSVLFFLTLGLMFAAYASVPAGL